MFPWCEQVVSELLSTQTIFSLVHNSIILNYVSISYICAAGCSYPCQIPHGKYILHLDDRWRYGMTQFKSYENLSSDASISSINQWTRLGENLKMNCESYFLHQFFLFVARNTKCGAWCFLFATCFTRILIYQFSFSILVADFLSLSLSSDLQLCPWSCKINHWPDLVFKWLRLPERMPFSSWIAVSRSWRRNCWRSH